MLVSIDEDILKKTTQCKHDFVCLDDDSGPLCAVRAVSPQKDVLFTFGVMNGSCPYSVPVGPAQGTCACPVRIEMYNRYGI